MAADDFDVAFARAVTAALLSEAELDIITDDIAERQAMERSVSFVTRGQRWRLPLGRTFLGNQLQPQHCRRHFHWPRRMRTSCTRGGHVSRAVETRHLRPESQMWRTPGAAERSASAIARRRSRRSSSKLPAADARRHVLEQKRRDVFIGSVQSKGTHIGGRKLEPRGLSRQLDV